jgi:hypothetical protein
MVDSKTWKHNDAMWPDFTKEPRNLHFALIMDGMNPFGDFNLKHSTWLVLLLMYNLLPWLVIKNFFILLSFIIPRKNQSKMQIWTHTWPLD